MEDPNNSQGAPGGDEQIMSPTYSSELPASSLSSENKREWNSRFANTTTPLQGSSSQSNTTGETGGFWMALNDDGNVAGSTPNQHGPSTASMQLAQVLMGFLAQRGQEDQEEAWMGMAAETTLPKAKPKPRPKARFQNYKKGRKS